MLAGHRRCYCNLLHQLCLLLTPEGVKEIHQIKTLAKKAISFQAEGQMEPDAKRAKL